MKGPFVVGGIGGSGTRAIASVLQSFGIYIGEDLNVSLDNLAYTFLFRRPGWYKKYHKDEGHIETGLRILEKNMVTREPFLLPEKRFLLDAALWNASHRLANKHRSKPRWICQRLKNFLARPETDLQAYNGWGWKEPNSHLLLDHLARYFPGLKYIHTVRHGLDMAYSSNQSQLFNWGAYMGVPVPASMEELPSASLRYWAEVNREILNKSHSLGQDKVYLLNFDRVCQEPAGELEKMVDFLGINVTGEQFERAVKIPITPESTGRFRRVGSYNGNDFRREDLDFLESMGFAYL